MQVAAIRGLHNRLTLRLQDLQACQVLLSRDRPLGGTLHSQADHTPVTIQKPSPAAKLPDFLADQLQPPPLYIGGDLHKPKLSGHRLPKSETPRETRTSSYAGCVAFCC